MSVVKLSEGYARLLAREAFFWAWPMVNVYNRRLAFKELPEPGLMDGIVPCAPLNELDMLSDYIAPEERMVACPNQRCTTSITSSRRIRSNATRSARRTKR